MGGEQNGVPGLVLAMNLWRLLIENDVPRDGIHEKPTINTFFFPKGNWIQGQIVTDFQEPPPNLMNYPVFG